METQRHSDPLAGTGIADSKLPGPYPVGDYARALRVRLREFARVQLVGEIVNLRVTRSRAYFELRDGNGALPCAAWRPDWERIIKQCGEIAEGMQIVIAGGCDYYAGSSTSSPTFSFSVSEARIAGEGDLLVRIERLRKTLAAEGLLERQKALTLNALPRTIAVICSPTGKAKDDILAALRRRGWAGRLVWAFAPVQDRHAAPAIARSLQDLAASGEVEVAIVARGGGSLADLLCFCDETLCRTVALLSMPVIASVGHHTDRTLLDDVAAVSCSTPTHAAEAAVPLDCASARADLCLRARRIETQSRRAVLQRARALASHCRAPAEQLRSARASLHQQLRETRAAARRRLSREHELTGQRLRRLSVSVQRTQHACDTTRYRELQRLTLALAAHDPQHTLRRGYALVEDTQGELVTSAVGARKARALRLRFADGALDAEVRGGGSGENASAQEESAP